MSRDGSIPVSAKEFPPDSLSREQKDAYEDIAGDPKKLVTLEPRDCDCEKPRDDGKMIPVEQLETAGKASEILMRALTRGKSKGLPGYPGLTPAPGF